MEIKSGDVITYKDGTRRVFGRIKIDLEKAGIIKIERPTQYETVFERKEEILDKAEKKYLSNVIRPFRDKIEAIYKYKLINSNKEFISIRIKNCTDLDFPGFQEMTKYKGMKINKKYTLEELGL